VKTLLKFFIEFLDYLYLDPRYKITDSTTSGSATNNAAITLTGPTISWQIANDRGQILFDAAPTTSRSPENWFRVSIIREYLDSFDERGHASPAETAAWIRDNGERIESLFSDARVAESCRALTALEEAKANEYWGPSQQ
jgi:hypothetical protein